MKEQGTKRIEVIDKGNKRQITAVFGGTMMGDFLPPQLIYEGKIERCLRRYKFPAAWHVTQLESYWSNETTMKQYSMYCLMSLGKEKSCSYVMISLHC